MKTLHGIALAGTVSALLAFTPDTSAGVTGQPASGPCDLSAGLSADAASALEQARTCLLSPPAGVQVREDVARDLAALINRRREKFGLEPLALRPAFSSASGIHAMDLAVRGYAAQTDLEGRDHEYRLRLLDRQALISASGAVITILPAGSDAVAAYNAALTDPVNAENLLREEFTHLGLSTIESNGRLYTVIVMARVDGELDVPLSVSAPGAADLEFAIADPRLRFDRWALEREGGDRLAVGLNRRLDRSRNAAATAFLDVHVTDGRDVLVLRGPVVGD